jgi:hypothetical protein
MPLDEPRPRSASRVKSGRAAGSGGGAVSALPLSRLLPEDVAWAFARLRPQAGAPRREPCPLTSWPPGDRAYILCREDHAISPAWSRRAARERLGVEAIELEGSHSPFLSRPATLAEVLDRLAR